MDLTSKTAYYSMTPLDNVRMALTHFLTPCCGLLIGTPLLH